MTIPAIVTDLQSFLGRPLADDTVRGWLTASGVALATALALWIVKRLFLLRLGKLAERTGTNLDDLLVDLVRRTTTVSLIAIGIFVAHHGLTLSPSAGAYVVRGAKIAMWLQAGLWGLGFVHYSIQRMVEGKSAEDPARTMGASVLDFIGRALVWSLVLLLCLQAMGQEIGPLLASLGVGGIAVALALQNILGDLFASITILLDKPFVVGDSVVLGDFVGKVERIGIKTTRIRSITGESVVVGNNDLVSSRLRNFHDKLDGRQQFTLGVTYQTSAEKLARIPSIVEEIVAATPGTRFQRAHFKSFGDFALLYEIVYFVLSGQKEEAMDAQHRINLEIHRRFEAEAIEFAYPTQTLHHVAPASGSAPIQKELSRG